MSDTTIEYSVADAEFTDGSTLSGSWTVEYNPDGTIAALTNVNVTVTGSQGATTFTGLGTLPYADPAQNGNGKNYYEVHNFGGQSNSDYPSLYLDWTGEIPPDLAQMSNQGNLYTSIGYYVDGVFTTFKLVTKAAITVTVLPCFAPGTLIATPAGEVAVETISAGDEVTLHHGGTAKVRWVGQQTHSTRHGELAKILPVRIQAGALGNGLPKRDLYVSPDHSMYLDGVLIPANLLQNGKTITQMQRSGLVHYHHIELDVHDLLVAEGAATESYLDTGNRRKFTSLDVSGKVTALQTDEPKNWEDSCAPIVVAGPQLEAVRAQLNALAAAQEDVAELAVQAA